MTHIYSENMHSLSIPLVSRVIEVIKIAHISAESKQYQEITLQDSILKRVDKSL